MNNSKFFTELGEWKSMNGDTIKAKWYENPNTKHGSIWVYKNDRIIAFGCSLERAQAIVNAACGQDVWTATDEN